MPLLSSAGQQWPALMASGPPSIGATMFNDPTAASACRPPNKRRTSLRSTCPCALPGDSSARHHSQDRLCFLRARGNASELAGEVCDEAHDLRVCGGAKRRICKIAEADRDVSARGQNQPEYSKQIAAIIAGGPLQAAADRQEVEMRANPLDRAGMTAD